jgi:hypothetical protein
MKKENRHSRTAAFIDEVIAVGAVLVLIGCLLWILNSAGDGLAGIMLRMLEAG